MIVKNKTNGKEIPLTEKQYNGLSAIAKLNFTIISKEDEVIVRSQVVDNKAEKKTVAVIPPSGEKKTTKEKKSS